MYINCIVFPKYGEVMQPPQNTDSMNTIAPPIELYNNLILKEIALNILPIIINLGIVIQCVSYQFLD